MLMESEISEVTSLIARIGKIAPPGPDDDFYAAGFSSITALELLTEIETAFDVSLPDDEFIAARSIRALASLVHRLRQQVSA